VRWLLGHGADSSLASHAGFTPVLVAAFGKQEATVLLLLDRPADLNAADATGRTALMGVSERGWLTAAKALVAKGANATASDNIGRTAAGYAALAGQNEMLDYLRSLTIAK
jgi:ankyrin repeat protein